MNNWLKRLINPEKVGTDQPPLEQAQVEEWKQTASEPASRRAQLIQNTIEEFNYYYRWLNDISGGFLAAMRRALETFGEARASEAAASLAYYSLFSLFPLLLAIVIIAGFFLAQDVVKQQLISTLMNILPAYSQDLVIQNVQRIIDARGSVGLLAVLFLIWSGSNMFNLLYINVDRAWPKQNRAGMIKRRAMAFSTLIGLSILFILAIMSTAISSILPNIPLPTGEEFVRIERMLWALFKLFVPVFFKFLILYNLYRWVPPIRIQPKINFYGALVVALMWELMTVGITRVMSTGLNRYELVYGSLGVLAALMLWIYWSAWLMLFGAHLTAAFYEWQKKNAGLPKRQAPI